MTDLAPAIIRIDRSTPYRRDLRVTYTVFIDGDLAGTIPRGQSFESVVEPGPHKLYVSVGRFRSDELSGDFVAGEIARFTCSPCRALVAMPRLMGIGGPYYQLDPALD